MVRLLFTDVDGTLVGSSGSVHPAIWPAAERAREAGIILVVCSGRPAFGIARDLAARLSPSGWHVFQNGASVVHLAGGQSLSARVAPEVVAMLVQRARATGRILELYTDDELAVEVDSPRTRAHADLLGIPFRTRPFESLTGDIVRAQWLAAISDTDVILADPHPGLEVVPSTSPVMPDSVFVNMTPAGVDKGTAVRRVAAELGVALAEAMYVGDGLNDVSAMGLVGHPVAMANAEEGAREAATRMVADVDDGGLAEALELALAMR
jgi:Cof subfamily protein (haloacid dehalogenase superfamily)